MDLNDFHDITITMTGTVLSSLIHENLQPGGEKEGFLLGKSTVEEVQVNNDYHSNVPCQQKRIVLTDFWSSGRVGEFYTGAGRLEPDKLTALFENDQGPVPVVGWYRFRRRAPARPSLRERVLHRQLSQRCGNGDGASFLFLLMAENLVDDVVQHDQVALVTRDSRLTPVRLEVANVGESGGGEYRAAPFSSLGLLLPGAAAQSQSAARADNAAMAAALAAQSGAHERLRVLLERLVASETDTAAAWREVVRTARPTGATGTATAAALTSARWTGFSRVERRDARRTWLQAQRATLGRCDSSW
ncbi:BRCA1-A complex subunit Abraxas 1-like isoform X2 [Pollicipes pollicipes]|uniref:BRCA1-A complex subunit Abraxas 1-like isoform X2 n=1 Tax=Pollicipes pollicipes TaxID=41117 RepID=UPI0018852143|nr:BRCA1-A complex subunit Abraxas 1-like isoform X2 [Pollicipes pollicipes]